MATWRDDFSRGYMRLYIYMEVPKMGGTTKSWVSRLSHGHP
jgi:hypothetical protein